MISRFLTPTFRLSFGLVGITLSLIMVTFMLGMFPNEEEVELKARAGVAEALALQLSSAASQHDTRVLTNTIKAVVARNPDLLSIALRRDDGKILLSAGDHGKHWVAPHEDRSTPSHIQIALSDGGRVWGKIEMAFTPLKAAERYLGIPASMAGLVVFIAAMGFAGYYFVLRRALRELDPGNVIPDRVQSAFNSLAEGILILDERGLILLANDAFAEALGKSPESLFGTQVSQLNWRQWGGETHVGELPWQTAVESQTEVTGAKLCFRSGSDDLKNFVVNATCISGPKGRISGVIATFDDVTELEQKNNDLEDAVRQLQQSEEEISNQNRELKYLASHDSLTGCLNRRAFFEQFSKVMVEARQHGTKLTCMMADLDHFKQVNDTYGHAVGDQVIVGMAQVLQEAAGETGFVGRYGGEEFCIVLPNLNEEHSQMAAETIRNAVLSRSPNWLKQTAKHVTSSIGVALLPKESCTVGEIVDWADQALYHAKDTGRNKVVFWDPEEMTDLHIPEAAVGIASKAEQILTTPITLSPELKAAEVKPKPEEESGSRSVLSAVDHKTGLPSEVIFNDRVAQAISRADWNDKTVAVLNIALNATEEIGTAYGEEISSEFVAIVASRFKSALKRNDAVSTLDGKKRLPSLCYLGDGKFAIEISDLDETNTITWLVKRLFDSLNAPVMIKENLFYASSDIGISLFPSDGRDVESLMRNAVTARHYAQKKDGKNHYQFFAEEMNQNSRRQMNLEACIRQALDHDLFEVYYQPIISTTNGQVDALEALLRSNHESFGGVPIGSLIAVAEQTGLITEIGEWVLKAGIRQIHTWKAQGINVPKLSINISAMQLNNKTAMERVVQILKRMQLDPSCLQFEITETAILRDSDAAADALEGIRNMGVRIALDDFGTGQSSLGYLRRFRPEVLKIDRCFIGEINTSEADETLVSAIVSMAQKLDIEVVAEGVETESQMNKVCTIGCNAIQGYFFARPMNATATSDWLIENKGDDLVMNKPSKVKKQTKVA